MLLNLLIGIPVMVMCLVLQAILVGTTLRYYSGLRISLQHRQSRFVGIGLLAMVMLLMMFTNFLQTVIWAALFMLIGEFSDWNTALYYSGVNFATLGYGDVVLSARWRLLGPLEAANGVLMFGVSTAVMTAAVFDVIRSAQGKSPDDRRAR